MKFGTYDDIRKFSRACLTNSVKLITAAVKCTVEFEYGFVFSAADKY